MSEGKIVKAWGVGCSRNLLVAIVAWLFIVGVLVGLVILSLSLPAQENQPPDTWFTVYFIFLFLVIFTLLFLGVLMVRHRLRQVDTAFASTGLEGSAYLWNGRQYHGMLNGRRVDAYFYRGPTLDVYIASPLKTRLGVGLKSRLIPALSPAQGLLAMLTPEPDLSQLAIYALDESWARGLLADSLARAAILRLAAPQPGLEFHNLLFQPEAIHLQLSHANLGNITADNLRMWLNDLFALARIAESLPPPTVTASATPLERNARTNRSAITRPVIGVACATLGLVAILAIAAVLLFYLDKGGF